MNRNRLWVAALLFFSEFAHAASAGIDHCEQFFLNQNLEKTPHFETQSSQLAQVSEEELIQHLSHKIGDVVEFAYIRDLAHEMGVRVWLFGGTASSFLHYVKWDLVTSKGLMSLQKDRFDYDFTNIFRGTQDVDIVVDAGPSIASEFQRRIARRFPHFLGFKATQWEVRTLRHRMGMPGFFGFKEGLLDDSDFFWQNTDSHSVGMIEITGSIIEAGTHSDQDSSGAQNEPIIRDLRNWDQKKSVFLEDVIKNKITYFRSPRHFETWRAKAGENPEILSVLRILVKAFQYDLQFSQQDFDQLRQVADDFNPETVKNPTAIRRIQDTAKKLVIHAVDIERAMNVLDELGLREKLMTLGNPSHLDSFAWWLNREPLRSKPIGMSPAGRTARELGIDIVAHETSSLGAMESITRSHSGEPNVLISRSMRPDESASFGNGFYTSRGRVSVRGTGLTIRFRVDPNAREKADFVIHGNIVVFTNKKALTVIPESLTFGWDDILALGEVNQRLKVDHSDLGLLEKQRRRFTTARIMKDLDLLLYSELPEDFDKLVRILGALSNPKVSQLIAPDVRKKVIENFYLEIMSLRDSSSEADITRYVQMVGPLIKDLDELNLLKIAQFKDYLEGVIGSKSTSHELRKPVVFEMLLSVKDYQKYLHLKSVMNESEFDEVLTEIAKWHLDSNVRKRRFIEDFNDRWAESLDRGDGISPMIPYVD